MKCKTQLILFTRFPESGRAKTRLIPALGADGAAEMQRQMTEFTITQACQAGVAVEVRYSGGSLEQMQNWLGDQVTYCEQGEGDLGEKMERGFIDHFARGVERVVLIGADCPFNRTANILAAFTALESNPCVLGPALDGGYYLIGLTRPMPQLFQSIDWGTEQVFKQTVAAAGDESVFLLPALSDVDEIEDIPPRIAVIIPTRNEAQTLPKTLAAIGQGFRVDVILADGGSTDGTCSFAERSICSLSGRAAQQNEAVAVTDAPILLFLHADTQLPPEWDSLIRTTLQDDAVALGAFEFRLDESFPGSRRLERATNWRARVLKMPYGDQGLFMRRTTFDNLGGFPEMPIMEDYAFVRAAQKLGRIRVLSESIRTSSRRWKNQGLFRTTVINQLMILGYHCGISTDRLARFYRRSRSK